MVKLHELRDDELLARDGSFIKAGVLKTFWEHLTKSQRKGYYVVSVDHFEITAEGVIDSTIDLLLNYCDESKIFELESSITEDKIKNLQKVLDDIFDNEFTDIYDTVQELEV